MEEVIALLLSPIAVIIYGFIIGIVVFAFIYLLVLKPRKESQVFEFESFKDTVLADFEKQFRMEGIKSKAHLTHGFKNDLGKVVKWLRVKGKAPILKYDAKNRRYEPKLINKKIYKFNKDGTHKLNDKGKHDYDVKVVPEERPYDLVMMKVKGEGMFETSDFLLINYEFITYDPVAKVYNISEDSRIVPYAGVWTTSELGEMLLNDISFRKSIENNMTYIQNYAGKIVFIETQHAKTIGKITSKHEAKALGFQSFAQDTLVRDGRATDEDDET